MIRGWSPEYDGAGADQVWIAVSNSWRPRGDEIAIPVMPNGPVKAGTVVLKIDPTDPSKRNYCNRTPRGTTRESCYWAGVH